MSPSTAGASGYPALSMANPTTPKKSATQASAALPRSAKTPTSEMATTSGMRIDGRSRTTRVHRGIPRRPTASMSSTATRNPAYSA